MLNHKANLAGWLLLILSLIIDNRQSSLTNIWVGSCCIWISGNIREVSNLFTFLVSQFTHKLYPCSNSIGVHPNYKYHTAFSAEMPQRCLWRFKILETLCLPLAHYPQKFRTLYQVLHEVDTIKIRDHRFNARNHLCQWQYSCKMPQKQYYEQEKFKFWTKNGLNFKLRHRKAHKMILSGR